MNKINPLVSIIIPVLNSQKTLEKCLLSVLNQTYSEIEIIVVDGGSNDKTIEIGKNLGAEVIEFNTPSMTKQTNQGIISSNGKYIYRIDSDVILPKKIVEECVKKCENEKFDGACVFWLPDDSISFWAKVRKIEKESYIKNPNYVGSINYHKNVLGARFLRRDVLDAVGGFDDEISTAGEDYALYNKLANSDFEFALIDSIETHIGEPKTIKEIVKKNFRYGTAVMLFLDTQEKGQKQLSLTGRLYLIDAFKKAFHENIILFFGLIVYLFSVYSSTALGILYFKITNKTKKLA